MDELISRQKAINALENTDVELTSTEWDELTDAIKNVPSEEPKTGRWIEKRSVRLGEYAECSLCNNIEQRNAYGWGKMKKYCPNCGAKMKGEEDDE